MNYYDGLKLDNQLCFALYASSREIIKLYKPYLDKFDLTYTQYIAMMVLWEEEEISVKELGARLYLDSGTLTPLLKKLESKGFIERKRYEKDERIVMATLTKKGRDLKEKIIEVPQNVFCETNLNMEEAIALKNSLIKLLDKMNTGKLDRD